MVKRRRRGAGPTALPFAAALLVGGAPVRAPAHPETSPQVVNRYLTLIVGGDGTTPTDRVDASYVLWYGDLPGGDLRRRMDTNADGRVAPEELNREKTALLGRASGLFRLLIDGKEAKLTTEANIQLGADDGLGPAQVVVELFASTPLARGKRRLEIVAGEEPPRLGETELAIDLGRGWDLATAPQNARGGADATRVKFDGPRRSSIENRAATFVIESRGSPANGDERSRRVPLGVYATAAALMFAAGAATLTVYFRRRRT